MNEIWKPVEGYENYEVSNLGNVRSLNYHLTGKIRVLKPIPDKDEYLLVNLYKEGKVKGFRVHRLVAMVFIENPSNLPVINHKKRHSRRQSSRESRVDDSERQQLS